MGALHAALAWWRCSMKRTFATIVVLALAACQQTTQTNTTTEGTTTVKTSTTTGTVTVPSVDTTATANAKQDMKDAGEKIKEGAREAAQATGNAMEKAGKKIQEKTSTEKTSTEKKH
jgi:hypothetical protein